MAYDLIDKAIEPGKLSTKVHKLVNETLEEGNYIPAIMSIKQLLEQRK